MDIELGQRVYGVGGIRFEVRGGGSEGCSLNLD